MRIGVMDFGINTRFKSDLTLTSSRQLAIAVGADSFWLPDHLLGLFPSSLWDPKTTAAAKLIPRLHAYYEPWTTLGYIAAKQRFARLRLGVGVTDAGRRNPAVTAQAAATLHHLSHGRAILGIGTGEREGNEPYGVDWKAPVGRFEEAIATIRFLWDNYGEVVSRESEYFPLRDALFDLPPYKGHWPEIWIAAHGPRMLRLTGRYADGWFPAFPHDPPDYATMLTKIKTAADSADRNPDEILPAAWFMPLIGRTPDEVDDLLASPMVRASAILLPATMWSRYGVEHPLGPDFTGAQDLLPQTIDRATALSYVDRVPDALMQSVLAGTPGQIIDRIAEWRDNGLRYCVLAPVTAIAHSTIRGLLGSNIGFATTLRGIRKL